MLFSLIQKTILEHIHNNGAKSPRELETTNFKDFSSREIRIEVQNMMDSGLLQLDEHLKLWISDNI